MSTLFVISTLLLGMMVAMTGVMKLAGAKMAIETRERLNVSAGLWTFIGLLELSAGMGLVLGLKFEAFALASAIGVVVLLMGGLAFHAKVKDAPKEYMMPLMVIMIAALSLVSNLLVNF